jgi:type VI secretion system secreted protein VgrG
MPATQAERNVAIATALGDDVLLVKSVSITESLGRLFQIEADLASETGSVNFDDILGKNATIRVELPNQKTRYFNGTVSRFVQTRMEGRNAHYRATLVPWLWFLTRTADCRIFQAMKVPDIVKQVFRDHGFTDFRDALTGSYLTWDFCVQYRETDFNFVSRLMEQEGIYYFFEHDNGKHTLVLADDKSAHKPFPDYATVNYRAEATGIRDEEYISDWVLQMEVQTGVYSLNDFNFTTPKSSLLAKSQVSQAHAQSNFEIYDYPGEYDAQGEGQSLYSKLRIQEHQAQHEVGQGHGNARGLATGSTFTLGDFPRTDQNRDYLITETNIHITGDAYEGRGGGGGEFYTCAFTAIPSDVPYRSPRVTPKPLIQGPQTAIVVGPSGDEIYTDQYGRVKLQFHWDRYGKSDENSSCWVRVSNAWAGKQWGAIYIPRIGHEVIVEFLEGDPDQPIITGRVYNAVAMPPYALPAEMTKSTVKTNSSKGGQGFNEIRFEDKKGSEEIFVHGEKDQNIRIKNDCLEWIGNNRHLVVIQDQLEHVENNRNETVDNDHKELIGNDRNLSVAGKEAVAIAGSKSLTVTGDVIEVFKGNHSEQVTSDYYLKADNIVIEGMTNVTIKVGSSFIAIEAGGISIGTSGTIDLTDSAGLTVKSSAQIQISDSAGLTVKSSAQIQMDAPQTTVKGDAMLTLKGGVVMIN